jgi:LysM repeat protein
MKSSEFLREDDDTDRYKMYTVKQGDTLGKLASRLDTTVQGLMWLNPQITNRDLIITGNTLRVPKTGGTGPVQPPSPKPKPAPNVDSTGISDAERAWLNMIASQEADQGSYDSINYRAKKALKNGKMKITGAPGHHPFEGQTGITAAGRYQFLWNTWEEICDAAGLDKNDFSPENQDRAALALAKSKYNRKYNRDLVADLQDPKYVAQAIKGSTGPWSVEGPGFDANKYIAALDQLGRQTAEPKAKK